MIADRGSRIADLVIHVPFNNPNPQSAIRDPHPQSERMQ
jgi:hypothetical protein